MLPKHCGKSAFFGEFVRELVDPEAWKTCDPAADRLPSYQASKQASISHIYTLGANVRLSTPADITITVYSTSKQRTTVLVQTPTHHSAGAIRRSGKLPSPSARWQICQADSLPTARSGLFSSHPAEVCLFASFISAAGIPKFEIRNFFFFFFSSPFCLLENT